MNYREWADEYTQDALRIKSVIDRKNRLLHDMLTADERKRLLDEIAAYRTILYELSDAAQTLRRRAVRYPDEA